MSQTNRPRTITPVNLWKIGGCLQRKRILACQEGSILVGIIITMVIMATLGAGMIYMTTTSTFQELFANNHSRAYYAAESGGRYAAALIRDELARTGNATPINQEFVMANGDRFQIANWVETLSGSKWIDFDSIGTVGTGFLQAKRKLRYKINPADQKEGPPPGGSDGDYYPALPRDVSDFEIPKRDLDLFYSPVDMSEVDIKDNPSVQSDPALNLKSEFYITGLKWYDNVLMAQLDDIRDGNNYLLSYAVQVKILDSNNPYSNFNIVGISFRLDDTNTTSMTSDTANPDMYGISFVKLPSSKPALASVELRQSPLWYQNVIYPNPMWDFLSSGSDAGKWFVVLWKRAASAMGAHTPLAYNRLISTSWACASGTTNCSAIREWSTLMVKVEETIAGSSDPYNFPSGTRYNVIKSYMQASSDPIGEAIPRPPGPYLRSTTASPQDIWWADEKFQPINWTLIAGSGAVLGTPTPTNIIADASLTTLNYDLYTDATTIKAREIGLHIYNVSTKAQNIFYDNFYIDLSASNGGGGGGGGTAGSGIIIQYP